jgi:hypothetical protein
MKSKQPGDDRFDGPMIAAGIAVSFPQEASFRPFAARFAVPLAGTDGHRSL